MQHHGQNGPSSAGAQPKPPVSPRSRRDQQEQFVAWLAKHGVAVKRPGEDWVKKNFWETLMRNLERIGKAEADAKAKAQPEGSKPAVTPTPAPVAKPEAKPSASSSSSSRPSESAKPPAQPPPAAKPEVKQSVKLLSQPAVVGPASTPENTQSIQKKKKKKKKKPLDAQEQGGEAKVSGSASQGCSSGASVDSLPGLCKETIQAFWAKMEVSNQRYTSPLLGELSLAADKALLSLGGGASPTRPQQAGSCG
eukprot:RCo034855